MLFIIVLKPHGFVDIDNATLYLVPVYTKHACIHAESDNAMLGSLDWVAALFYLVAITKHSAVTNAMLEAFLITIINVYLFTYEAFP